MCVLCWNCFREKDTEGACPHCGYDGAEQLERFPLALRPGSILNGQYIVGRVLGQGGFGITYLALNDRTKERVSIKEYYPVEFVGRTQDGCSVAVHSADRREDFNYGKEQFLAEARTLAAVTGSDNILRIYSYFEENGTAYFSMEYIEGRPLDAHLKGLGRPLRAQEAEDLFLPLMTALETVHKKGIIHRDIAPDNIIVTPNGLAKLIDFGAARYSTGEKSKSLDVILKHGFAPMEQYTRRGRQGPWTDVYAMAATYYFSVTGKVPPDAIDRITGDTLEKPSELGVNLGKATEAVLLKALSVQAPERWQNMGEFRAALQTAAMAEATLNWSDFEPILSESGVNGEFVTFDEIAVKIWIPEGFNPIELADEDREKGFIGCYMPEDQSASMSVVYVDTDGMTLEQFGENLANLEGVTEIEYGTVNGLPCVTYQIPDQDSVSIAFTTEAGYILEVTCWPLSEENATLVWGAVTASIQPE